MLCNTFTSFSINISTSRQAASQQVSIIDIIYLLWTIVPNELILVMLHMIQWINIVDYVTNTIQKPVVWTRVFIYQFGRHHGGCEVYTTSKSLYARGGHSHIMELLMLVNQPQKWTLNGVIGKGWFATLNGVTLHISNPKWRNEPKSYPKWRIGQNLTLNAVLTNILYKRCNKTRHWQHHQHHHHRYHR